MARRVLFVRNDPTAPETLLGEVFTDLGWQIDTLDVMGHDAAGHDPAVEATFPDPRGYDAIVPLGARWHLYGETLNWPWIDAELDLLRRADAEGVAVLGVCFGGQLLAHAHGGSVARSPYPEVGWLRVDSEREDLVAPGPWFAWHSDRWTLPPGAVEIARTSRASHAFRVGRALALQFHPELDDALLARWIDGDRDGEAARHGVGVEALRAETAAQRGLARARLATLVRAFLEEVAGLSADQPG